MILPQLLDLSPRGIREHLKLSNPIYQPTSAYGHFGRKNLPWETVDLTNEIKLL